VLSYDLGPPNPFPVRNALSICALVMNCDIELWFPAMPAESIKWFIEGQAFSLSYDFALPPPPTPSLVSKQHTGKRTKKVNLLMGE
jgi:hypothetical protein